MSWSNKWLLTIFAASGGVLLLLGWILYSFYLFPEIEQLGDFVMIGQSRWTLPSLVIGVSLLLASLVLAIRGKESTHNLA